MLGRTLFFTCAVLWSVPASAVELEWSYDNDFTGQEEWGNIAPICEAGTKQSPIQISFTKPSSRPRLDIRYNESKAITTFEDGTVSVNLTGKNELRDQGKPYHLKSIRFHSPSEHMVRDKYYLSEIQLVHESKDKTILTLSIFTETGPEHAALKTLLAQANATEKTEFSFDPSLLLPAERGYYAYTGSLTYPPCTEGVEWRIFKTPLTISREQLGAISSLVGRNARLPQPVYMRTIEETLP